MSEINFDTNVTRTKTYTKFVVNNIEIKFGEPAKIDVMLLQNQPASPPLYETIYIPVETYTNWQYNENTITDYCKTFLQNSSN
jgi:hypothetical protein